MKNNMYLFSTQTNQTDNNKNIPQVNRIAEEAERIATRELDEYIKKGKFNESEDNSSGKTSKKSE